MATTIGADPEFFIRDSRTGQVVPAIGTVGGSKDKPRPLDIGDGYFVQEDNVMVEFNVPAARSIDDFAFSIMEGREAALSLVRTRFEYAEMDYRCSRLFPFDLLNNPKAMEFGCSPDLDAYRQGAPAEVVKPIMLDDDMGQWRFAGGHIHIGYESEAPAFVAASFADVYLGLPSLSADRQGQRRPFYGTAGRYREKSYGIEYRTLSNFWVFDRQQCEEIAWRAMQLGNLLENNSASDLQGWYQEIPWRDVQQAMTDEDVEMASSLLTYITEDIGCPIGG